MCTGAILNKSPSSADMNVARLKLGNIGSHQLLLTLRFTSHVSCAE